MQVAESVTENLVNNSDFTTSAWSEETIETYLYSGSGQIDYYGSEQSDSTESSTLDVYTQSIEFESQNYSNTG